MIGLDTNILLRLWINDDPAQNKRIDALLAEHGRTPESLLVTDVVTWNGSSLHCRTVRSGLSTSFPRATNASPPATGGTPRARHSNLAIGAGCAGEQVADRSTDSSAR